MRGLLALVAACALSAAPDAAAQEPATCRVLCTPEFKVEPTITFSNVLAAPKIVGDGGLVERDPVEAEFELILSLGLPTEIPWLGFTVETIFLPFERESTPELEIESNFTWLASERTGGWLSSHFDVVDKFSAAERPGDRRAYTHKLNFELDTSVAVFNWLAAGRWLRGLELEGSIDYVATGLPEAGETAGGVRFLDAASPWSFSIVFVLPVAPL